MTASQQFTPSTTRARSAQAPAKRTKKSAGTAAVKGRTPIPIDAGFHATRGEEHLIVEGYNSLHEINITIRRTGIEPRIEYPKSVKTANMQIQYYRTCAQDEGFVVKDLNSI